MKNKKICFKGLSKGGWIRISNEGYFLGLTSTLKISYPANQLRWLSGREERKRHEGSAMTACGI